LNTISIYSFSGLLE